MLVERTKIANTRGDPEATRQILLDAAFKEIYQHGFRVAGLDAILAETSVTKGALYHHFGNKLRLGYAVVEERVKPLVRRRYLDPFKSTEDPIVALQRMGKRMEEELMKEGILEKGCPLNNLVLEMSGIDDEFRLRLGKILEEWKDTIAEGLSRGQSEGMVRPDVDPEAVATFFVASYQGACGYAKNSQDIEPFTSCRKRLDAYSKTLRPSSF